MMNIVRASAKGDFEAVKKYVEEGVDINMVDNYGRSALLEAAWGGHLEIVKYLLEKGAAVDTPDKSGFTPLMRAVEEGHYQIAALLIKKGANVNARGYVRGTTPLMLAAEKGDVKIIELLLENGAKINAVDLFEETALARAYKAEQLKAINYLEEKGATRKPEHSLLLHHNTDLRPVTKATLPQWRGGGDDLPIIEDEDIGGGEDIIEEE